MKTIFRTIEFYIFTIILILGFFIEWRSGDFFSIANLADLLRGSLVPGLMALPMFLIIISGGIDISFPAIGALAAYIPLSYVINNGYTGPVILPYLIAMLLGVIMGLPNGYLIGKYRLSPLIVTAGTWGIYRGLLMGGLNAITLTKFPDTFRLLARSSLFSMPNKATGGIITITPLILILILAIIFVYIIVRYTRLGRGIYAVGGSNEAADRLGFNNLKIKIFLYCFMGMMAALAAMLRYTMLLTVQPTGFDSIDMVIISMAVIGGVRITGGYGTIIGTILGVVLIVIINNSLILLGIGNYWHTFFHGLLIVIGTSITGYQALKQEKRTDKILENDLL